jgi:hypothetical protein
VDETIQKRGMSKKHVIFLGAGASVSSGYPLANRLALLMSDRRTLIDEILHQSKFCGETWANGWFRDSTIAHYLNQCMPATEALRDGAFASMDELSRLSAGGVKDSNIRMLKKLMRFVLAIYNPHQNHLSETDYRPFIQSLFGASSQIREDVSIISFNYDPYLEFSLRLAFTHRQQVNPQNPNEHADLRNAITSGFENPADTKWLNRSGFCHLKLHGACVLPGAYNWRRKQLPVPTGDLTPPNAGDFFHFNTVQGKLATLVSSAFADHEPPAILPWEIVHDAGRILTQAEFNKAVGTDWQHAHHYNLFSGLWKRARREVLEASRVSFVGLSFGPFLEPAFKFLFREKANTTEFCVANSDNKFFQHARALHPRSPAGKAYAMLENVVAPECMFTRTINDLSIHRSLVKQFEAAMRQSEPEMTCYDSFREFIDSELR